MNLTNKSNIIKYSIMSILSIVVIVAGVFWYIDYLQYVSTDDARVDSDNVSVSSKILGRIVHLYAAEGDTVSKGMLLVELDSLDLIAQRANANAIREQAISSKTQAEAKYRYDEANLKTLEINLTKAFNDLKRAKEQISGGVITQEQFEHIQKNYEAVESQFNAAKIFLNVTKAQIRTAASAIESAKAQIAMYDTELLNTKIYSPSDGILAKRWLLSGDVAQPSQSIFTLTKTNNKWIIAFLEETKLENITVGQNVEFSIDAFKDKEFYGKIFYIASNSASQFSLIPPNNASGNFTKVTQRIPIKISIDGDKQGDNINNINIISGMSAEIRIKKNQ